MGFCLFSNAAIAARHALASGVGRVMIVDWDVHHGNGTNAALHDSAEALFVSLHRYPFYPGTGPLSDAGSGEGTGFSVNLPLPGGSGEEEWLSLMEHVVAPVAAQFRPELVLVCAGYDAHRADPLGGCLLETSSYGELGRWSRPTRGARRERRWAACWRAATPWTHWPPRSPRRWRRSPIRQSRARCRQAVWSTMRPSRSAASGRCSYFRAPTTTTSFASPARSVTSGSMRAGAFQRPRAGENTTIGLVATNAKLTKSQVTRMAMMADDGYARAISPSHTNGDGDTIFSLATGRWDGTADITVIGALAAEAMADAVVRAATQATGVAGIPAARDLKK